MKAETEIRHVKNRKGEVIRCTLHEAMKKRSKGWVMASKEEYKKYNNSRLASVSQSGGL